MTTYPSGKGNGIGAYKRVLTGLIFVVTVCLLISSSHGNVMARDQGRPPAKSIDTIADGSVIDENFDGIGDWVLDGESNVWAGFNAFGPGETRGVYEFDISEVHHIKPKEEVTLQFYLVGRRMDWSDFHLTLYACQGNGILDLSDYSCDHFVTAFVAPWDGPTYDISIDVTGQVRELVLSGNDDIVFVIRPNPSSINETGGVAFNNIENTANYGYPPAALIFQNVISK